MTIQTVHMDFLYGGTFRTGMPEAYERLILDAMLGDSTLFTRTDEVEEQWLLVDAIVAGVAARPARVPELRGRARGGRRAPTSSSTGTAGRGDGTKELTWVGEDVRLADVDSALAQLRGPGAEGAASCAPR